MDSFHCYYVCGGIAQVECGLIVAKLQEAGAALTALLDLCLSAGWRAPGRGHRAAATLLRPLFDDRVYEERQFKGTGSQTRALVFLLGYYVARLLLETGLETAAAESFLRLKTCCAELRRLQHCWTAASAEDCAALNTAQREHQREFNSYYGEAAAKPKHHFRFHLHECSQLLGNVASCETHEAKHRIAKSGGLVDAQKGKLGNSAALQASLLPRMLLSVVDETNKHGLNAWGLRPPSRGADLHLQHKLRDATLQESCGLSLWHCKIEVGDVVLWASTGIIVERCLCGNACGVRVGGKPLTKASAERWGSVWQVQEDFELWALDVRNPHCQPSWWKFHDGFVSCLH